jgi:hypothetical protein
VRKFATFDRMYAMCEATLRAWSNACHAADDHV